MKKQRNYLPIAAGVGLLLCLAYVSYGKKDIAISGTNWARLGDKYKIEFSIENRSNRSLEAQILIVATRRRFIDDGEVFEQIGQKPITVKLAPREKKSIEHDMAVSERGRLDVVNVYAKAGR